MKVKKLIAFEQEVEVEVGSEDIAAALYAESDTSRQVLIGINSFSQFCKAIKPETIAELNDAQRTLIADFFEQQAKRFSLKIS